MKKVLTRAVLVAALCVLAGMAGCAPQPETGTTGVVATEDVPYREEKVQLPDELSEVLDLCFADDGRLLVAAMDSTRSRLSVLEQQPDGTCRELFDAGAALASTERTFVTGCLTSQGRLLCITASPEGADVACALVDAGGSEEAPDSIAQAAMDGHIVNNLRSLDEHTVFVLARQKMARLDLSTGEAVSFALEDGELVSDVALVGDLVVAAVTRSSATKVENEVAAFDAQTGARVELDPGTAQAVERVAPKASDPSVPSSSILLAGSGDELFVRSGAAVYRCGPDGAARVLDGADTHLANDNQLPARLVARPGTGFAVQYHMASITSGSSAYRYIEGESSQADQTLTLYMLEDNSQVQQAVATFRDERPDVAVEVRVGIPAGSGLTADDAVRTLNADVLAGTGPDVLVLDGLPVDDLAEQGLLLDLADERAALEASGDYYANVLGAYATDEGCFALPSRFVVPTMAGQTELLAHAGSIEELASFFDQDGNRGLLATSLSLTALYLADYPNLLAADGSVDEGALKAFYASARKLLDVADANFQASAPSAAADGYDYRESMLAKATAGTVDEGIGTSATSLDLDGEGSRFALGFVRGVNDFGMAGIAVEHAEYPLAFEPLAFGGTSVFQPRAAVGVSANSSELEAAKAFVEHLLSEDQQAEGYEGGMPVCKAAFEERARFVGGYTIMGASEGGSMNRDALTDDELAACNAFLESATFACAPEKAVNDAFIEGLLAYCRDEVTLDNAATEAVRKVNLYRAQ